MKPITVFHGTITGYIVKCVAEPARFNQFLSKLIKSQEIIKGRAVRVAGLQILLHQEA